MLQPEASAWAALADLPWKFGGATASILGGKIRLTGGGYYGTFYSEVMG